VTTAQLSISGTDVNLPKDQVIYGVEIGQTYFTKITTP
jgi:hypothetical protein